MLPVNSSDSRYAEYENLLFERDQLLKEADQIWIVYLQYFGQLITENYEAKIECIKSKKTIAYLQNAINHGGSVDSDAMREFLDKEMVSYYANLKRMAEENENAKKAKMSSAYEAKRSKELYRKLVKLIHPDMKPATDENTELQELWQRIQLAYRQNSIKELSELEVLVRKELKTLGIEDVKVDIPDIEDKIEEIKKEMQDIVSSTPYTYRDLIEDRVTVQKKKDEILSETKSYKDYLKELNEIILKMMSGGGLSIYVK